MTVAEWLRAASAALAPLIGADDARRDARLILQHATGWSAARTATSGPDPLPKDLRARADSALARRLAREPLAQILGHWPFYGREFQTTRATLTPRPDTECLIDAALRHPFRRLVDLGTGSGIIAITLLAERPEATGLATDLSPEAINVAEANARVLGVSDRLTFARADWWTGIEERFDLVVSNPPYVTEADYATLAPEIVQFEPRAALTPGGDGLGAYRAILRGLPDHAAKGARVLLEIGADQGPALRHLMAQTGLVDIQILPDLAGRDRVAAAIWP